MSHENGNWMNSDQRDATKPHECFGFTKDSAYCGQCGWPLKPGFRVKGHDVKILQCACCGRNALGKQWWNQDTGYGVCARCAYDEDQEQVEKMYGKAGEHYAAYLSPECKPGMLVGWKTLDDEWHVGTLTEWDNGTAIIKERFFNGEDAKIIAVRGR